jgi:heme/copper-type cytochrome/quinol oxidase subunit 2
MRPTAILPAIVLLALISPGAALAAEPTQLILKGHRIIPDHITVPAGTRFHLQVSNQDDTVDEFESYDLRVEKLVVAGGTITVAAGPLHPGTYKVFDDYHPDTAVAFVTAVP